MSFVQLSVSSATIRAAAIVDAFHDEPAERGHAMPRQLPY